MADSISMGTKQAAAANGAPSEPPFLPFAFPDIGEEEIAEVVDTLRSGWLTSGPKVQKFEAAFRELTGASHAVALSSATAGLHLALLAAGIGEGDEVITTPFTFAATVNVILHCRARPILADISEEDYNIDVEQVAAKITPRTKAILPVHYSGQPCNMDELMSLARSNSLRVIEDAAHAVGAEYHGKPVGVIGDASVFSFYVIKSITTGQGGMLTTNDEQMAEQVRLLSLHGLSRGAWNRYSAGGSWAYEVLAPGFNYVMTDIQAAIGIHQFEKLRAYQERRTHLAARYNECFAEVPEVIRPPVRDDRMVHPWHLYPIRLDTSRLRITREEAIEELRARRIGTSVHFIPINLHSFFQQELGVAPGDFPIVERVFSGLISLPLYPRMEDSDVDRVADAVREIIEAGRK